MASILQISDKMNSMNKVSFDCIFNRMFRNFFLLLPRFRYRHRYRFMVSYLGWYLYYHEQGERII